MIKRMLLAVVCILALSTVAMAQYPYSYSRSQTTKSGTNYYGRYGSYVGRSYKTGSSTYWQHKGRTIGRSYTTGAGNTYYFNTQRYSRKR